jgi:predicted metal-dependent phosphoesterase TrpH
MIDLHVHSTFSDGSDTPEALAAAAGRLGLRAIALTDHDNANGVPAFLDACRRHGVTGIGGVEISAEVPSGTLHILGYGIAPAHAELRESLDRILDSRDWRNHEILKRLQALGFALAWEEVAAFAGEDVVGRPHFARAMIARGYVRDSQDAFDRFLAKGQPAYVDRFRLAPEDGVRLIRAAGGVPVLAHPFTWIGELAALESALAGLHAHGLAGIEAYYPEHSAEQTVAYLRLARKLGLLVTGGTDYHGAVNPQIRLGTGFGGFEVPDAVLEPLWKAMGRFP